MTPAQRIDALVCGLPARERATRRLMMLAAFIDDSGTDGTGPFAVLAGYVSTVDGWKAFSDAWDSELRASPTIAHFKMSEANGLWGPFRGWDIEPRDAKVARLAAITNKHVVGGVACIVSNNVYRTHAKGCLPDIVDNPYWLCFQKIVLETVRAFGPVGKVDFVFDEQGEGYERRAAAIHAGWRETFNSTAYGSRIGSLTFASDLDVLPLQAADLLAWHVRRRGAKAVEQTPEKRPVDSLLGNVPIYLFSWDAQEVSNFVETYQRLHPASPINRPDLH